MQRMKVKTRNKREVVDITDRLQQVIEEAHDCQSGFCHLSVLHTTAALTTADLDPGTDLDMLDAFEALIPKLRYRHPHNPEHVPDHILSALIGTSVGVPVEKSKLVLGTWAARRINRVGWATRARTRCLAGHGESSLTI